MTNNQNIKKANVGDIITIGRMKGNIKPGLNLYKLQSKTLNDSISPTFKEDKEFRKQKLCSKLYILKNVPMKLEVYCNDINSVYYNEVVTVTSEVIPSEALNVATTKEKIITQISKTGNTPFQFEDIELELDDNLFVPVSSLNELRRNALEELMSRIIEKEILSRNLKFNPLLTSLYTLNSKLASKPKINLLLNVLDENFSYYNLTGIDRLFIPLKYFILSEYSEKLKTIHIFICQIYYEILLKLTLIL